METSIFMDKSHQPNEVELKNVLGIKYYLWLDLRDYVFMKYPKAFEEWSYSGAKYGWSFRIKDSKRALIYLLPREHYFKVAIVFGEKATKQALASTLPEEIKKIINDAPVYAEGRGFRIEIPDEKILPDIKRLIDIKLSN